MLSHVGIVGYGRMGGLIAKRLINDGKEVSCLLPTHPLLMESPRCDDIRKSPSGITFYRKPEAFFSETDIVVLAVRPAHLEQLAVCAAKYVRSYHSLISIMASTSTTSLKKIFPHANITRIMPNIYIDNKVSYIPYFHESERSKTLVSKVFEGNRLIKLETESLIDGYTKINGCSPAMFSWMFQELSNVMDQYEILADECDVCKDPKAQCNGSCEFFMKETRKEARQALLNVLYLTAQDLANRHPQTIINEVASPGGVTRATLDKLPSLN